MTTKKDQELPPALRPERAEKRERAKMHMAIQMLKMDLRIIDRALEKQELEDRSNASGVS